MNDQDYMHRCLDLARSALAAGEAPVGAVLVRDERIVGEGIERTRQLLDPGAHAEVEAVRSACREAGSTDLSGSTLYSTVEPCVLCAYVIRRTGISRVVYGMPAGQAGAVTSPFPLLEATSLKGWPPPPQVVSGVLETECRALMAIFSEAKHEAPE